MDELGRTCAFLQPSMIAERGRMPFSRASAILAVMTCSLSLGACSLIELSGKMTRTTGEVMTEYSAKNDGVIGKAAGFGGKVNTAVGTAVEDAARSGKDDNAANAKARQSVQDRGSPSNASAQAVANQRSDVAARAQPMSIADAQRRLAELGYEPGAADGLMGRGTVEALKQFQRDYGLPLTGKLDRRTSEALQSAKRPS